MKQLPGTVTQASTFSQSLAPAGVAVNSTLLAITTGYAVARTCREAGAWVSMNVSVRVAPNVHDTRRPEKVVEGLPLHGGHSWPVTPPCRHTIVTERPELERRTSTEQH